jgi:hypothetical protein
MLRTATIALVAAALAASAAAAPVTDWKQVSKVAGTIPTAAGVPLLRRMAACQMTIHHDTSWIETRSTAWPDYGARPGDTVLKLVFDVPPAPPLPGPAGHPNPPQRNVIAIWVISHGQASPISAWARALQQRPVPLGYDPSNNC